MEQKNCKSCIYYVQHYGRNKDGYNIVHCGHCNRPEGHYRKTGKACEFYQEKDIKLEKEERMKSATKYLSVISMRISELAEIMRDEN